jgi:HAMP domain-containing protein
MTTVLLIVIVILLLAVLALLLSGWPGRELKEIEEIGRELRRELAQQRADSVQLLHSMRIELDDSLRETLEQKLDSIASLNSRQNNRRKKQLAAQSQDPSQPEAQLEESDEKLSADDRQLGLFSGSTSRQMPAGAAPLVTAPVKTAATFTCAIDDIPDIDDMGDLDDV